MKFSIRWTIITGCFVLVWGTHIIITPSSYFMTKAVLTRHMQDIMVNISDLTLVQAHNHLNKAKSAAVLAKQLLASNVVTSDIGGAHFLERYFFDQLSIYPHLAGIYVADLNGDFLMVSKHAKYQPDGFRTKIIRNDVGDRAVDLTFRSPSYHQVAAEQDPNDAYDPRTRPWFAKAKDHSNIVWTDPYIFYTAQKPGVTIAGSAYGSDDTLKGIIGVDIEIAELSTFISKLRVGKTGKAFILHENGDVIAYHDMDKLIVANEDGSGMKLPKIDELDDILAQEAFHSITWQHDDNGRFLFNKMEFAKFEHDNKAYLSMFTPFPDEELPWVIGVYIPEDDYLADIKASQLINIAAAFLISIIASILGLIVAKKIISPVVKLADGAKVMTKHDIEAPFHVETMFKEIQETADSFSRMKVALLDYKKQLHDSEKIYRAITSTANDAIILLNSDHEITFFNPAAEKMSGYTSQEVIGRNLYEVLVPEDEKKVYRKGLSMFMENETGIFKDPAVKAIAQSKDGHRIPVELSLSKLQQNNVLYIVAIIRNITERVKAAGLRKRLVSDLHDGIGGTLSNIKLLAEITKGHRELPTQTLKNLNGIAECSEDCIAEIQNYINVLDNPNLDWTDFVAELHQYCAKNLELHDINFSKRVNIQKNNTHTPTTLLYMSLFKIIKEALNNVIKHSNATSVTLETTIAENHAEWIFKDNGTIIDSPTDSGRGLIGMTSRVKELGGTINFSMDNGFYISIQIPFSGTAVRDQMILDDTETS
jgi:two-component system, cell cycle sensor histidine kinase and response regulator CckA